jgi:hypothetical protein
VSKQAFDHTVVFLWHPGAKRLRIRTAGSLKVGDLRGSIAGWRGHSGWLGSTAWRGGRRRSFSSRPCGHLGPAGGRKFAAMVL